MRERNTGKQQKNQHKQAEQPIRGHHTNQTPDSVLQNLKNIFI